MLGRRGFLAGMAGFVAAPLAVEAQQAGKVWKVGFLSLGLTPKDAESWWREIEAGLGRLGFARGAISSIVRLANGERERLPDLARQLVEARVDAIVAVANNDIAAAKQVTKTIPIVMVLGVDPVATGFVASFSRPGANITGTSYEVTPDLASKWVELLKQSVPGATRIALLWDPAFPGLKPYVEVAKTSASRLGIRARTVTASSASELPSALASLTQQTDDAVVIITSSFLFNRREEIVATLNGKRLPTIFWQRQLVEAGGLMSYGVNVDVLLAHTAFYLDRIFRGAKPADLPIEQPTKLELVINLKTAKAIDVTIPALLLLRADKVIE